VKEEEDEEELDKKSYIPKTLVHQSSIRCTFDCKVETLPLQSSSPQNVCRVVGHWGQEPHVVFLPILSKLCICFVKETLSVDNCTFV
jgi:hypothetical protein